MGCNNQWRGSEAQTYLVRRAARRGHSASGYQASIVKLESQHAAGLVFTLLDCATGGIGPVLGFDPRYRVLVGRMDTEDLVGVREARTLRRASQQLAEVEQILATSSEEEAQAALGLDA